MPRGEGLYVFVQIALLLWFAWLSIRFFHGTVEAWGEKPDSSSDQLWRYGRVNWQALTTRQADPRRESQRRQVWLAWALFVLGIFVGPPMWDAVAGALGW